MSEQTGVRKVFKNISNNTTLETNPFAKACDIRQESFVLFQEALKASDEAAAGFVADEHLRRYMNHVSQTSHSSVSNYTTQVAEMLKARDKGGDLPEWNTSLNDLKNVARNPCSSQFMGCNMLEINAVDLLDEAVSTAKGGCEIFKGCENEKRENMIRDISDISPHISNDPNLKFAGNAANFESTKSLLLTGDNQLDKRSSNQDGFSDSSNRYLNLKTANQDEHISCFRTARDELHVQNLKKYGTTSSNNEQPLFAYGTSRKSLGARRGVKNSFVPPIKQETLISHGKNTSEDQKVEEPVDERLKNIDPRMVELISSEIMHKFKPVDWNDIAGLEYAKATIQEAVVWPLLRPDIFKGLRRPPRGILLFGPPGTGKTLIGKCIASQSKSTFFSISASSLTSKWIGEGEKMVRALFSVAAVHQPAVIFIDEIDSLLCQRSETEHESSRRIKTEFLVQLDGAATSEDDRILIVGATNRPQELDEAARRRLVRRLYIPLPELEARQQILKNLLKSVKNNISAEHIYEIGKLTEGYSGADMECLCREASMEPIRSIPPHEIPFFNENEVRDICFDDFRSALRRVKASVSQNDLMQYIDWNKTYGSGSSR